MTLPYKRNFTMGRQSEQFLNDEFHNIYKALENINYRKNEHSDSEPLSNLDGALWFDRPEELLKYYDANTLSWKNVFSKKFQITDQILNLTTPPNPVVGQLWIYNGVLMYFDGSQWVTVKAASQDEDEWSSAAFEDFRIISPLNAKGNAVVDNENKIEEVLNRLKQPIDDSHKNTNFIELSEEKWSLENWQEPEIEEPTYAVPDPNLKSQYIVPNLNTDRVFLANRFDTSYETVSTICFQYPTKDVYNKILSAVHLNPNRISSVIKRFVKLDKLNPTIKISSYYTEFYGFRKGEIGGDFLIPSKSQDYGDYVAAGDYIVLNYNALQNYDYLMSVTYDFSWVNATGNITHQHNYDQHTYYIPTMINPINVHTNGLKLEEAAYDIDLERKTVTINDSDANNVTIQMWSPYDKQFGYIREIDLEGNGIIKLTRPSILPLVFVGGMLIHPLYGGLIIEKDRIIVPNVAGLDTMRNMAWCVVDLYSPDYGFMYNEKGRTKTEEYDYIASPEDYLDGEGNFIMHGDLTDNIDPNDFRDYILAAGTFSETKTETVITYDTKKITDKDEVILFVNGLMINNKDIIRDKVNGIIKVLPELEKGQEYVLLRDRDGRLYNDSTMIPAYATGYIDESLVYLNGQLLGNRNCVRTTEDANDMIAKGMAYNEIKLFMLEDETGEYSNSWKIYDSYNSQWVDLPEEEVKEVDRITNSYENLLNSISFNINIDLDDDLDVFTIKLASSVAASLKYGEAVYKKDNEAGQQMWQTGVDSYAYGQNVLNVFRNGVKLVINVDYKESTELNYIIMLHPMDIEDKITYIIQTPEPGETFGREVILLSKDNSTLNNVYSIGNGATDVELYPGRLVVYINGLRLPKEDWLLLDNKRIMLKYNDYQALGSADNFPTEYKEYDGQVFTVTHSKPDYILIEKFKDYDRQERTLEVESGSGFCEIYPDDYNLPRDILDSRDEVLFYLNGQFLNLSRSKNAGYKINKYKGCIAFQNSNVISALNDDPLKTLFDRNALIYNAWKKQTGNEKYTTKIKNKLTMVWR